MLVVVQLFFLIQSYAGMINDSCLLQLEKFLEIDLVSLMKPNSKYIPFHDPRRALSQFYSFKIRGSPNFMLYRNNVVRRILKLQNCERARRATATLFPGTEETTALGMMRDLNLTNLVDDDETAVTTTTQTRQVVMKFSIEEDGDDVDGGLEDQGQKEEEEEGGFLLGGVFGGSVAAAAAEETLVPSFDSGVKSGTSTVNFNKSIVQWEHMHWFF